MRIVQLANFVTPTSGGIRTVVEQLRTGYAARGHQVALVVPGSADAVERGPHGPVVTVAAPRVPGTGGYRAITAVGRVLRILDRLGPDRVEVHDRSTLRAVGPWARRRGVPATAVVHERLDRLAGAHLPWLLRPGHHVRRDNARLAAAFDRVVTPSAWAAQEFEPGAATVVGWGVDLDVFTPARRDAAAARSLRRSLTGDGDLLVAVVVRLSPEKRPEDAVSALAELRRRGVDARMAIAGTGRSARSIGRRARDLPIALLGHLDGRDAVADLLAAADVAICPGPLETFGLAGLEALAVGTPVVSARTGAIAELLRDGTPRPGIAAHGRGPSMASAVLELAAAGEPARLAARRTAVAHRWDDAIDRMLDVHGLLHGPAPDGPAIGDVGRPVRALAPTR